jgi:hypothetical protein
MHSSKSGNHSCFIMDYFPLIENFEIVDYVREYSIHTMKVGKERLYNSTVAHLLLDYYPACIPFADTDILVYNISANQFIGATIFTNHSPI